MDYAYFLSNPECSSKHFTTKVIDMLHIVNARHTNGVMLGKAIGAYLIALYCPG